MPSIKKTTLVFGGTGFIGGHIVKQAEQAGHPVHSISSSTVDIRNKIMVENVITDLRPDAVINTAALADVDFVQQNQELAVTTCVRASESIAPSP